MLLGEDRIGQDLVNGGEAVAGLLQPVEEIVPSGGADLIGVQQEDLRRQAAEQAVSLPLLRPDLEP